MLIKLRDNEQVKIITGIRRCGKSFLLNTIYRNYLVLNGVSDERIITLDLDDDRNARYRNPIEISEHVRGLIKDKGKRYYILIDEIQRVSSVTNPYLKKEKAQYLSDLFSLIYIKDVIERNHLKTDDAVLDELLNVIASAVGSLTNLTKIADTFNTAWKTKIKNETISRYLDCFIEAFILNKAYRYDIKGRSDISTPLKYYFSDAGLRNAKLNFRQQEENHVMENALYNEFIARSFNVDVGVGSPYG